MIYKHIPENFNPRFEIVGIFCEYNGDFLLLHRQDNKPQGNRWGMPAGKIDAGENTLEAMVRELKEEIGLDIPPSQLNYFDKVYVKYPDYDFIYHIFHTVLDEQKEVKIRSKEHKEFKWVSPEKALEVDLIQDLDECIKLFYKL